MLRKPAGAKLQNVIGKWADRPPKNDEKNCNNYSDSDIRRVLWTIQETV
jgi:hypothetical protein